MRSLQITFPRPRQVQLLERDIGNPGNREVRCRALSSLVSTGTESFCLNGTFDPGTFWEEWVQYPFSPGYSMTSEVVDIGPETSGIAVGDRVATSTPHHSAFLVPATDCIVVPEAVTNEQACWASLACTTQLGVRRAEIELGESAAVVGLGALGQLVVQYLRLSGARHIIAIEPGHSRASLARKGGATEVITADVDAALDIVCEITGAAMVDVAFDITGHPDVLAPTTRLVHPFGRVILLGDTPTPSRQHLGPRIVADSVSVLGVHASAAPTIATPRDPWTLPAMTSLFFDWVSSGHMDVDSLVTHRFVPSQAADVYESLQEDRSSFLGVILDWTGVSA